MAIRYLSDIDLSQNSLKNVKFENLATAPANPRLGQLYYNTVDNKLKVYTPTGWQNLGAGDPYILQVATETEIGGILSGTDIDVDSEGHVTVKDDSHNHIIENVDGLQDALDDKVDANSAITGATHTKITYDSKGLITGGTDLTANDIPSIPLSKVNDVTATAAEVNVLDGITASTTELNYVDGVTAPIQGQLNNKVEKNADITAATHTKITYDKKGLVTGGSDLTKNDIPDLSDTYITLTQKGTANGVATLDANGKVPSTELPSYVDDVIEVATYSALPATGETGKIYITLDTNKCYRWGGSTYVEISQAEIHKFTGTITGNGTNTSFAIAHGLGTKDVIVNIYDASTNERIMTDVEMTSTSTITVIFAQPVASGASYKVVVVA